MHRRKFLRLAAAGFGSALLARFLSACAPRTGGSGIREAASATPVEAPTATASAAPSPPSPQPSDTAAAAATQTPEPAYLAVAHGGDDPEALVRAAVDALGGIRRFVPAGARVLIKPNICTAGRSYECAATTNPWVVAALVRLCREADAGRVRVLDYPFFKSSQEAYVDSGIGEQVEAAGGEMIHTSTYYTDSDGTYRWVDYAKWVDVELPNARRLTSVQIIDEAFDTDVLINVPIAKDHDLTRLTLGMKNLMGLIHNRPAIHSWNAEKLPELAAFLRPALTVVDAVRILTAYGPRGGNTNDVVKTDTVIASQDIVAADACATSLFGLEPADIGYIIKGAEAGLGTCDLSSVRTADIPLG